MCWRFGIDYPKKNYGNLTLSPTVPWEVVMLTAFAKRQFMRSHRLHLYTWWWKRLQEAREVHSSSSSFLECPQSCWWLFWHFQLWSQVLIIELLHCRSFSVSLSKRKKRKEKKDNELVDWSVGGMWHKSVNNHCLNGEWVPVATKIMNLLKKSQPPCLKLLEAKRGKGQQDIVELKLWCATC